MVRILAAMLQVEVNPVQNASFAFVSSGFGEFETGLLENTCSLTAYESLSANMIGSSVSSFVFLTEQRRLSTTSYRP